MTKHIFSILLVTVSLVSLSASEYPYKSKETFIGEDKLEVCYGDDIIFITVDQMQQFDDDKNFQKLAVQAKFNGKPFKKNKVFKTEDKILKVSFASSDTSILKFKKASAFLNQGFFFVKSVGKVDIIVKIDGIEEMRIPITARALDIESKFDEISIVEFIGEPTKKNIKRIPYNTQEVVDGIVYNTEDLIKGIVVKHWIYDEYPGAILVIDPYSSKSHVIVVQPAWLNVADELFKNF